MLEIWEIDGIFLIGEVYINARIGLENACLPDYNSGIVSSLTLKEEKIAHKPLKQGGCELFTS